MTTDWQPMDTAPRDGTRILLWRWETPIVGYWDTDPWHVQTPLWFDDISEGIEPSVLIEILPEAWAPITPYAAPENNP